MSDDEKLSSPSFEDMDAGIVFGSEAIVSDGASAIASPFEFETIVIRPIIKARGVFSEGGRAEVWLSDDSRRIMVQLKTHMKLGSLSLFLRSYTPPKQAGDTTSVAK